MSGGTETPTLRPADELLAAVGLSNRSTGAQDALRNVAAPMEVIQDFRPLAETLEWEIGNLHWSSAGVNPFVSNEVPFIINNSGAASERAAEVLFANCLDMADRQERIAILELGAGTGLFARYLLDAFQRLCDSENRDFYQRLVYFVSDWSPRSAAQWMENDVFRGHEDHIVTAIGDARQPIDLRGTGDERLSPHMLRGVFCNYVLDVLPCAIMRKAGNGLEQLCVRTQLNAEPELLALYSQLSVEELRKVVGSGSAEARQALVQVLTLLQFEAKFLAANEQDAPPFVGDALALVKEGERVLLNHGAIQCLDNTIELLAPGGFVLINDYGPTSLAEVDDHASSQRFGSTSAVGLNFPLLEAHFAIDGIDFVTPPGDADQPIHARLLVSGSAPQTVDRFNSYFGSAELEFRTAPAHGAREHVAAGRYEEALECFRTALVRNPRDWSLIGEIAEFVGLQLRDFAAGMELAREAITLNPTYSTQLWNVLGDCLYCQQRGEHAHEAYLQALQINPDDVRTNFNLSYTYLQMGRHRDALGAIADALARDYQGVYRERLLEKQQQIVAAVSSRWLSEQERLMTRMRVLS